LASIAQHTFDALGKIPSKILETLESCPLKGNTQNCLFFGKIKHENVLIKNTFRIYPSHYKIHLRFFFTIFNNNRTIFIGDELGTSNWK